MTKGNLLIIVRVMNTFLTAIYAGLGAVSLSPPWSFIVPLLIGATTQALFELIALLSPDDSMAGFKLPKKTG